MISRKRILGFAIGKMLRQDGWAEKYNSKNQFNVNQYDYSTNHNPKFHLFKIGRAHV